MQPTIRPLFDTKQFQEALLAWLGKDGTYHDYIKETWNTTILNGSSFSDALHDGVFVSESKTVTSQEGTTANEAATSNEIAPASSSDALRALAASVKVQMDLN